MRTIDGRVYAEEEDARRLEAVMAKTLGFPVKLRVVNGRFEVVSEEGREVVAWRKAFPNHSYSSALDKILAREC